MRRRLLVLILGCAAATAEHQSLVLLKPDVTSSNRTSDVLERIQGGGFAIIEQRLVSPRSQLIRKHYEEHLEQSFYPGLEQFMLSGDVMALKVTNATDSDDPGVYKSFRKLMGVTDSRKAAEGTLRREFGTDNQRNAVHASEDETAAIREIDIWFPRRDEL